jgi:hypothetical protein
VKVAALGKANGDEKMVNLSLNEFRITSRTGNKASSE